MTETKTFEFRSKFCKYLNDENRENITAAFSKFCSLDTYDALYLLWELTYKVDAVSVLEGLNINLDLFPAEKSKVLRNELRYQYENANGTFKERIALKDKVAEAELEDFKKHTDPIVANIVYEHCIQAVYMSGVERILYLLSTEKENTIFGGIRSLRFNKDEAEYLKPLHIHIYEMLKNLYENTTSHSIQVKPYNKKETITPHKESDDGVKKLAENVDETKEVIETVNEVSTEKKTNNIFKPLKPLEILEHKDEFSAFVHSDGDLNLLVKLGELGFDLNEINAKKGIIGDFLDAVFVLEN